MGKQSSKRPRPSYEDGKLRDPRIEKKQRPLGRIGFLSVVRKAVLGRKAP